MKKNETPTVGAVRESGNSVQDRYSQNRHTTAARPAIPRGPGATADNSTGPLPSTLAHLAEHVAELPEGHYFQLVTCHRSAGRTRWAGQVYQRGDLERAATDAAEWAQHADVYLRVTGMERPPADPHKRGGADLTGAILGTFVDLDVAGPGHAEPGDGLPLPTWRQAGRILAAIGIPPTVLVHTGGGLHAWYYLAEPIATDTDEARTAAVTWLRRWGAANVRRAAALGYHLDAVGDAARVGRLSGTWRRKPNVEPNRVYMLHRQDFTDLGLPAGWEPGRRYDLADLERVADTAPPPPAPTPPPAPRTVRRADDIGPADLADRLAWSRILEPAGFRYVGTETVAGEVVELWLRPGDPTSTYSLKAWPGYCVVWSDAAGLPAGPGQRLTKWRVLAHLTTNGNERELGRLVRRETKGGAR